MSGLLGSLRGDERRLYIGMLANFVLFGATMTLVGATLPRVIRELGWSYTLSGAVLASGSAGYVLASFSVGFLIHRAGLKRVMVGGLLIQFVGFALFARSPSPVVNMLLYFIAGIGQGCTDVTTNLGAVRLEREGESRLMNLVHAAFCLGGVGGPLLVGAYLRVSEPWGEAWRLLYPAAGALVLLAAFSFIRLRFPPESVAPSGEETGPVGAVSGRLRTPLLALLTAMILLYVCGEIGFSNWASEYFVTILGVSVSTGALMVSVLWLGLLAGRFGLSVWYTGSRQDLAILVLSVLSTGAVVFLRAASSVPLAVVAAFLTGLGFSGVYPMGMTLVGRWFGTGKAVGLVTAGGGVGSLAFPFLMGYLGERAGIGSAVLLCAGATALLALLSVVVVIFRPRASAPTAAAAGGRNTE